MFPSFAFKQGQEVVPEKSKEKLLKTKKIGKIRLHSMVKMRASDFKTIGKAYEKENSSRT